MLYPSNDSELISCNIPDEGDEFCTHEITWADAGEEYEEETQNEYCIGEVCCEWATIRIPPEEGVDAKYFCQECYSDFYNEETDESDTDESDTDEAEDAPKAAIPFSQWTPQMREARWMEFEEAGAGQYWTDSSEDPIETDAYDIDPEEYLSSVRQARPKFGDVVSAARSVYPDMGVKRLLMYIRDKWPLAEGGSKEIRAFDRQIKN